MQTIIRLGSTCLVFAASLASIGGAQHHTPSPAAMGFDQGKTQHHFRLSPQGGAIEIVVRERRDTDVVPQVRAHLQEIARDFAAGRFEKPRVTHGETPAGVEAMRNEIGRISFTYEEMPRGGRVVIATRDQRARNAVHEFLRYQIREHKTGDPLTVSK